MLTKFHGKFRDLIPNGFTFQKLYARNYRCYWKETKFGETIWIWQHHGGYIEIDDFHSNSGLVINAVLRGESGPWALDMDNKQLFPFEREKHDSMYMSFHVFDLESPEGQEQYRSFCNRWRRVTLEDETITAIKDMAERGWIMYPDGSET